MSNLCAIDVPSNPTYQAPTGVRTPPYLKWLLNERAAIAGDIARLTDLENALARKRDALRQRLALAEEKLNKAATKKANVQASLDALTRTIELEYAQVNPASAGAVKAQAGKYGKRGGLKQFVAQQLVQAGAHGISTSLLIQRASHQFQIPLSVPHEQRSLKDSVKSALSYLRREGKAEILSALGANKSNVWHWTADRVPSLDEMLRAEREARSHDGATASDAA